MCWRREATAPPPGTWFSNPWATGVGRLAAGGWLVLTGLCFLAGWLSGWQTVGANHLKMLLSPMFPAEFRNPYPRLGLQANVADPGTKHFNQGPDLHACLVMPWPALSKPTGICWFFFTPHPTPTGGGGGGTPCRGGGRGGPGAPGTYIYNSRLDRGFQIFSGRPR